MRTRLEANLGRLVRENAPPQARAEQARKLINFDPTHEGAVRALMTAFAEMGDRPQRFREYERCRQALKSILDLSPSKETVAVYEAVRLVNSSRLTAQPEHTEGALNHTVASDGRLADTATPVPDQPSIAVLPFRNLSGYTAHDYAGDGLVEDLIAMLSRVPNFFVISRLSAVAFRNHDYTPQQIGELLGVQYVVSGSIRILGDRLRLTVELTDSRTGTALWSSRLDERFFDFLEVQDRLADAIVRRLAPYLRAAELKRTRIKRPEALGAMTYSCVLRRICTTRRARSSTAQSSCSQKRFPVHRNMQLRLHGGRTGMCCGSARDGRPIPVTIRPRLIISHSSQFSATTPSLWHWRFTGTLSAIYTRISTWRSSASTPRSQSIQIALRHGCGAPLRRLEGRRIASN